MTPTPDEILTALANEVQIYQIPPKPVAELTDMAAVDDVNGVTWSLSLAKIVNLVQAQNTNIAVDVYISPGSGSDTTGNGSINNPYATIAHAQQQLLPSITANRPYNLILTSEIYNEPNLTINPYIYIVGNNATLKITGNITLGASWTLNFGGAQVNWYIKNCTIDCPNGITLDFTGAFPQPNFLSLNDLNLNSISVLGNQNQAISLKDVGNVGTGVNIDFQDVSGYAISGGNNNTIDLGNTSNVNQTTGFVLGTLSVGAISVSSTGSAGIQSFFMSSFVPNAIAADGASTVLLTDCNISAIPSLTSGAVWVPLSVASGVVVQYTPVYFPSVGGTVNDYFRAVDEQFGRLTYGARLNLTSSHVMTTPLNHQVYVNMVNPGQVVTLPIVNDTAALIAVGQRVYFEVSVSSDPFEIHYQDNTLFLSLSPGESLYLVCDDNTTPNGTWIPEYFVRTANGLNGQVTLDGLNVSASYPSPTNYTPTSTYVKGHLEGINAALTGTSPPGTTSYAYATFSQALNSAGAIAFSDITTYLPFIQFGAPASQIVSNLFDVTNDGNLHTIFVCKQPAGGVYTFTLNVIARTVNYNSQQNYFINIAKNGFSAANVVGIDYPFITYGTTDQPQISQSYVFKVACSYNDFIYLPVVKSAGSTSAFDTSLTPRYWQVCITQDATSFSAEYPLTVVTNNTINLATGNRYLFKASGQTVATLPTQAAVGSLIRIDGFNANGFRISQNAGQSIKFLSQNTTVGVAGFMVSISYNPGVLLQCVVADTDFTVVSANGTFGLN